MSRHISSVLAAVSLVVALASPADAATARRRAVGRTPAGVLEVVPLAGYDPQLAENGDLEPLRALIGEARVVALGETYHTSGGFYDMKHRIFRFLVEEMGFRAFAIESGWQGAERTAAYVDTCQGTPEEAIREHIPVWQGREYAELIRWMCEWNHSHPADRITFFGFDIQQPGLDGPALVAFLQRIGIPPSDPRSNGLRSCEAAFGLRHAFGQIPQEVHETCVGALDAVEQHLQLDRAEVVRRTSEDDFAMAMLRVTGLRAWQKQVYRIAHDFQAGYNERDAGMAYAFQVLWARNARNAKTVVWAANSHIARNRLPRGEQPLGSHLAAALGDDYVTFALTAYETDIDNPGYGCGRVGRPEGSVEELLHGHGHAAALAYYRGHAPHAAMPMGVDLVRPFQDYDAILFLAFSPRMQPLMWAPCK